MKIQILRANASVWSQRNPILSAGEPGFIIDEQKLKIGDGVTPFNKLPLVNDRKFDIRFGNVTEPTVIIEDDTTIFVIPENRLSEVKAGQGGGGGVRYLSKLKDVELVGLTTGDFIQWDGQKWVNVASGAIGATNFLALLDTPSSYSGQKGKAVIVNDAENALEFSSFDSAVYGIAGQSITMNRAVYIGDDNKVYYATNTTDPTKVIFVSSKGASIGESLRLLSAGNKATEPTWTWTPGKKIYVGTSNGLMTQVIPIGNVFPIAVAASATTIIIDSQHAIVTV